MGSIEPLAYVYASLFGIVTEQDYPYESQYGGNDDICKFDARQTDVSVMTMGWETLPHNDMLAVMDHLANKGNPMSCCHFSLKCGVVQVLCLLPWLPLTGVFIGAECLMAATMTRILLSTTLSSWSDMAPIPMKETIG